MIVMSSLFSLVIGSVLGLAQSRIKRLFAYSTISHIGFILLALSIDKTEAIQSYIFYILQYSIANLNAFIILLSIGYTLYLYVYKEKEEKEKLIDKNNSPVQLISQVKGYFYVNPFISISLAITLFSFVGIPPVVGFFAKQMILSAALDNGYIFMAFIAIITSVIAAAYYLNLIKQIFFFKNNYKKNPSLNNVVLSGYISSNSTKENKLITFNTENITINSAISTSISIITLMLILFIYMPEQ
jgi:NADH-ubiquinone oxidoreductase chain 2